MKVPARVLKAARECKPVHETDAEKRTRILSGEWKIFRPDDHEPVARIVSYLPEPDGRRCTNFLTLEDICEMMNAR